MRKGRYAWFGPDDPPVINNKKVLWRCILWVVIAFIIVWAVDSRAQTVTDVAKAIARTEGFYKTGTKPNRYHNPGDIRRAHGTRYAGEVRTDRRGYVVFKSDAFGWTALERNLQRIVDGTSTVYSSDPTFAEIAKTYATDRRWGRSVCKILRIDPQATLREYLGLAPRIQLTTKVNDDTLVWLQQVGNNMPELRQMPTLFSQVR